jgi:serine/threonine protein kinase
VVLVRSTLTRVRYTFLSLLGSVYLGKDIKTGVEVALKIGQAEHSPSKLSHEYNVYTALAGSLGIAEVCWYGKEGIHEVIALEYLGTSLDDLICEHPLSVRKTFLYASQMVHDVRLCKRIPLITLSPAQLSAVESLHTRHYIHRDIKPGNFMVRTDNLPPTIFLIDFGLAQQFHNPATYLHIPFSTNQPIVGTLPFMSINGQKGYTQSRRDDLESLIYTIVYAARGDLPWTGSSVRSNHEAVLQMKLSTTIEELCEGLPTFFRNFVSHVRSLDFDRKPDYQYLHSILLRVSDSKTEIDPPSNVLPPARSRSSPSTHSPASPSARSPTSPPVHSPASLSLHPSFNAHCAPVFSDKK